MTNVNELRQRLATLKDNNMEDVNYHKYKEDDVFAPDFYEKHKPKGLKQSVDETVNFNKIRPSPLVDPKGYGLKNIKSGTDNRDWAMDMITEENAQKWSKLKTRLARLYES